MLVSALAAIGFGAWWLFAGRSTRPTRTGSTPTTVVPGEDPKVAIPGAVVENAPADADAEIEPSPGEFARPTLPKCFPECYPGYDPNDPDAPLAGEEQVDVVFSESEALANEEAPEPVVTEPISPPVDPNADPDNDGLTNEEESTARTDPNTADTDGDGLSDGQEVLTHKTNPRRFDTDGDGLTDTDEVSRGTNPNAADSDADGLSDGDEVNTWKSDPKKPDTDGDGFTDGEEVQNGYNPVGSGQL